MTQRKKVLFFINYEVGGAERMSVLISKMLDENRYCGYILIQVAAIENALKEVGYIILKDHMVTCVSDDIKNNDFSSLEEAIEITKKLK